mgnify:CR=1 FL=1
MTPEEMQYVRNLEYHLKKYEQTEREMLIKHQIDKQRIETLEDKIRELQKPVHRDVYCKVCGSRLKNFDYGRKYCSSKCRDSMAEEDAMIEEMRKVWSKAYGKVKYYLKDDKEASNRFRDRGKVYKDLVYSKEITLDDFKKWIELELIRIVR